MATQLSLYNGALRNLKERALSTIADPVKSKRELDAVWNAGAVKFCLEQGYWNFAVRTAMFTPEVAFTASFGYKNQFIKPTDFVRSVAICHDEFFTTPNNAYTDEAGSWYSDAPILYVSYVSDNTSYGSNYASWPESFTSYVEMYLADKTAGVITGNKDMVKDEVRAALINARSKDAMNEPTKFMPQGNFTKARQGSRGRWDRGNRNSLIG